MTAVPTVSVDNQLEALTDDECGLLLDLSSVGRIAFVVDGLPVILPINYRSLSDKFDQRWILIRTRPGTSIDRAPEKVAFEIDGIDHENHKGWSVLTRGVLRHLNDDEIEQLSTRFDPKPWARHERSSWLAITPELITGRRLQNNEHEWAFPSEAYL